MHDLIIDINIMIMQIFREKEFLFFCITIFPEKAQNKNKGGIKTTFFINDENMKQKALHKFAFVSGGTKGYFEKQ